MVDRRAGKKRQPALEARRQRLGRKQEKTRSRQFDCQRKPFQVIHNSVYCTCICAGQFEFGPNHLRALHKERRCCFLFQRANGIDAFGTQAQRFAARRKNHQPRASRDQGSDPICRRCQMLEIVENEQ